MSEMLTPSMYSMVKTSDDEVSQWMSGTATFGKSCSFSLTASALLPSRMRSSSAETVRSNSP